MKKTIAGTLLFLFLCLWIPHAAWAQGDVDAWPEFDIWFKLNEQDRIYLMTSFATDEEESYHEGAAGIAWDRKLSEKWSIRGGYRYVYTQADPQDTKENRFILDAKYYVDLGDQWLLTNRNRVDLRFLDSGFSWRFRDRLQIERPFVIREHDLVLWSSFEVWHDHSYDDLINRNRLMAGFTFFFNKWLSTDIFYAFQNEKNPQSNKNAIGIFLGIWLDASN